MANNHVDAHRARAAAFDKTQAGKSGLDTRFNREADKGGGIGPSADSTLIRQVQSGPSNPLAPIIKGAKQMFTKLNTPKQGPVKTPVPKLSAAADSMLTRRRGR